MSICDYGNNPPAKLIIGSNPVNRIEKSKRVIDYQDKGAKPKCNLDYYSSCCCPTGYTSGSESIPGSDYVARRRGGYCDIWKSPNDTGCIKQGTYVTDCGDWWMECNASYPNADCNTEKCYIEPLCPSAGTNEVFIQEENPGELTGVCIYCPLDHSSYDPLSKKCLESSPFTTIKNGNCATFSNILSSSFTGITFIDNNNNPLSTADYVAVAYSCIE